MPGSRLLVALAGGALLAIAHPAPTAGAPPNAPTGQSPFPLRTVPGLRYLVDASGRPFFLHGDSPWSLLAQTTRAEAERYLVDRKARGFNAILVNLIEHKFARTAPKNALGEEPFLRPGDFAAPNPAYFDHADWIISRAEDLGILVLLTPAYLGWEGGDEGWYREVTAAGPAKLAWYGHYIATRFRHHNNIVWVHGGDHVPPSLDEVRALARAIQETDSKWLHTYHAVPGVAGSEALPARDRSFLSFDAVYAYGDVYEQTNAAYGRSRRPFVLIEGRYEGEGFDAAKVRAQAYQATLAGATGHFMGNRPVWSFDTGWEQALASEGAESLRYLPALLATTSWWNLVPDSGNTILLAGTGRQPYQAAAALAPDRSLAMVYLPTARPIRIRLAVMRDSATAAWYDPTDGTSHPASLGPGRWGVPVTLSPPGRNHGGSLDWVLVIRTPERRRGFPTGSEGSAGPPAGKR